MVSDQFIAKEKSIWNLKKKHVFIIGSARL